MVRILTNLRIDEISSVDRGAGEGVRVMLTKRHDGPDYRAIFKQNSPPGDQPTDDNAVPARLEQLAAALMAADPALSRQEAIHYLLHSARGRSLAHHLSEITKQKEPTVMNTKIEGLRDVAKQFGVVQLAKFIVDENSSHGMGEMEFFKLMQAEASTHKRDGETDAQAFDRFFSAPGNVSLRKAHAITKSGPRLMDVEPMQVGGAVVLDDNDQSAAMEQLQKLAEEQRARAPWMSTAQAFAQVFQDPKNAEIANRAHRRPAPTTSFAQPR